jgi:uncharacterized membrane protein
MRWLDYLKLQVRSRTGFSQSVVVWAVIALICAIVTFAFLLVAAYVWLAGLFGALFGALIVAGFFLLVALISLAASAGAQRRTTQRARLALASRGTEMWRDPKFMAVGVEIARAIGWRRIVPLAAIGVLAATLAREWGARERSEVADDLDARRQARRDAA